MEAASVEGFVLANLSNPLPKLGVYNNPNLLVSLLHENIGLPVGAQHWALTGAAGSCCDNKDCDELLHASRKAVHVPDKVAEVTAEGL